MPVICTSKMSAVFFMHQYIRAEHLGQKATPSTLFSSIGKFDISCLFQIEGHGALQNFFSLLLYTSWHGLHVECFLQTGQNSLNEMPGHYRSIHIKLTVADHGLAYRGNLKKKKRYSDNYRLCPTEVFRSALPIIKIPLKASFSSLEIKKNKVFHPYTFPQWAVTNTGHPTQG